MVRKFVIKNEDTGMYLSRIQLIPPAIVKVPALIWTKDRKYALEFDTDEEVRSAIDFIIDVINWELEGQLTIY